MKIRSLVLGSAAGALAVTGAQAADLLPVAPEPIDYVRVCDAFGPGYYYIPGTDTCLRVAGRIRADYNYFNFNESYVALINPGLSTGPGTAAVPPAPPGFTGTSRRVSSAYRFRARAYVYMDSRTNTEFGLLRTFTEVYFTQNGGGTPGGLTTTLNRAFIQFGGLTFGRTQSFYDFLPPVFAQNLNVGYSDTTTNVIAYTFAFGNGFSVSGSLEDEGARRSGILGDTYAGRRFPDLVGAFRVDQGWGSAQLMGALHSVRARATGDSQLGWAVGAGIQVNVPFGAGTSFNLQGGYTQGALSYVADQAVGGVVGLAPGGGFLAASTAVDARVTAAGNLNLVDAWSVSGGFETAFTPTISYNAQAGYVDVNHDIPGGAGDFQNYAVEGNLAYAPVSGMVFAVGAQYKYVDLDSALPAGADDPQALSVFFRGQRTF